MTTNFVCSCGRKIMDAGRLVDLAITNLDGRQNISDGKTCRVCLEDLGWFPTAVGPTERQLDQIHNTTA